MNSVEMIADPMRREILRHIWHQEESVNALVGRFNVSQPAISFHLKLMREGGFVAVRSEGKQRYYKADPAAFGDLQQYLEQYWQQKLSVLKDKAEIESRRRRRGGGK